MTTLTTKIPTDDQDVEVPHELAIWSWQAGPPPGLSAAAEKIDRATAWTMLCPKCRRRAMRYFPLHRQSGQTWEYGAYARCRCGHVEQL